jgi:ABC-type cobalamin/Fe3+-siderophores transport system ATPase subunit
VRSEAAAVPVSGTESDLGIRIGRQIQFLIQTPIPSSVSVSAFRVRLGFGSLAESKVYRTDSSLGLRAEPALGSSVVNFFCFKINIKTILKEVSFRISAGEYVTIIGPNGAGKSTLLKCITRIHRGGQGRITLRGRPLQNYSQRELARHVCYVPQASGRRFSFTVFEFVALGRYPYLSPFVPLTSADKAVVQRALAETGIEGFADRYLGTLSSGEQQLVFIAAALAQEGELLLLDEPTTFLDPKHQDAVHRLLGDIHRQNSMAILAVSHDVNSAALQSQRVLALKEGEVVFDGSPKELMTNDVLERVYDKKFQFSRHPHRGIDIVIPGEPPSE